MAGYVVDKLLHLAGNKRSISSKYSTAKAEAALALDIRQDFKQVVPFENILCLSSR